MEIILGEGWGIYVFLLIFCLFLFRLKDLQIIHFFDIMLCILIFYIFVFSFYGPQYLLIQNV